MKILKIIIVLIFLPLFLLFRPYEKVKAQEAPFIDADCGFKVQCIDPVNCMLDQSTNKIAQGTNSVKFIFDLSKIPTSFWNKYTFYDLDKGIPDILEKNLQTFPWAPKAGYTICRNRPQAPKNTTDQIIDERPMFNDCGFVPAGWRSAEGDFKLYLQTWDSNNDKFNLCEGNYSMVSNIHVDIQAQSLNFKHDLDSEWKITVTFADKANIPVYVTKLDHENLGGFPRPPVIKDPGTMTSPDKSDIWFVLKPLPLGTHLIELQYGFGNTIFASKTFEVVEKGTYICNSPNSCKRYDSCTDPVPPGDEFCLGTLVCCQPPLPAECKTSPCTDVNGCDFPICKQKCPFCQPEEPSIPPYQSLAPLCDQLTTEDNLRGKCWDCMGKGEKAKIWTAIGCLSTDLGSIIKDQLFGIGLGFAGAIAFLYFLYGAFIFLTSRGNPERVAMGKEIIVSSLLGLMLIIFSIFLLRIIAVDILDLPEFD